MSDDSVIKQMENPTSGGKATQQFEKGELQVMRPFAQFSYSAPGTGRVETQDGSVCTLDTQPLVRDHEGSFSKITLKTHRTTDGGKGERLASVVVDAPDRPIDQLTATQHNYGKGQERVTGERYGRDASGQTHATATATGGERDPVGVVTQAKETLSRAMGNAPKMLDNSPEALQEISKTMAAVGIQCSKDGQPSTPVLTPDEVGLMAKQALGAPKPEKGR